MPAVRWNLKIASFGSSAVATRAAVEAKNWMEALRAGRQQLEENEPLPAGVTCSFAPDGTVTLLDPEARRRIIVEKATDGGNETESQPAAASAASTAGAPRAPVALGKPQTPDQKLRKTVAFEPAEIEIPSREIAVGDTPAGKQKSPAKDALAKQQEQAPKKVPIAKVKLHSEAAARASAQETKPAKGKKPSARTVAKAMKLELLLERHEEPTDKNPLTYRERVFLVPKGSAPEEIAGKLREVLVGVQNDLENAPKGKLVNLAAFDHRWEGRPLHPPLVILQWKDWRGDPQVAFPKAVVSVPPAGSGPDVEQDKLANAFEALHDLFFLSSPVEGLQFVIDLLQDVVPAEAYSTCLYDIDTNELRFVVLTGPQAEQRKGQAVPLTSGLMGHAARTEEKMLVVSDVASDERYDPAVDGRNGLQARNMLVRSLISEGRLIGVLQLINRVNQTQFSRDDINLVNYVAKQLSYFLHSSRLGLDQSENNGEKK